MKVFGATTVLMLMMFIAIIQPFAAGERDLRSQLMDFKTLIPQSKLRYIVNKHYTRDAQFRHVMQYINTPEFDEVVQMVQQSSSYRQIIKYLQNSGINTTSIEDISSNVDILLALLNGNPAASTKEDNAKANEESDFYSDEFSSEEASSAYYFPEVSARSVQTFSNEIARAIPRKAFHRMVEEKMQVNPEFQKFYSVVSSKDFRRLILSTVRSKELDEPLRILKKNGINVRSQSLVALKVLSWGPRLY